MKMERINDNQLKIIINSVDLNAHNVNVSDILNGSDKTQGILKQMMDMAFSEFGFHAYGSPIIVEVSLLSSDSLMLVVTKTESDEINTSVLDAITEGFNAENAMKFFAGLSSLSGAKKRNPCIKPRVIRKREDNRLIFSFDSLDDVVSASTRINSIFYGESALVELNGGYFLIINNNQSTDRPRMAVLTGLLGEYGKKQTINECYLTEHGRVLIKNLATVKLASYL